jgi:hypothetical protein
MDDNQVIRNLAPEECEEWKWFTFNQLSKEMPKFFLPVRNDWDNLQKALG